MSSIQRSPRRGAFVVDHPSQILMWVAFVAVLSYFAAELGGTIIMRPQAAWPLWPGNVLLVSILLLVPRRIWPLLLGAAFAAFVLYDLQSGVTIRSTALLILSDLIEVLTAAWGLSYAFDDIPQLDSVESLAKYALFAIILPPFIGAFIGALASRGDYWTSWRISFFSEALAYMTLLPAILGWISKRESRARESTAYYLEATALLVGLVLVGYLTFVAPRAIIAPALPVVPLLLWAALRFGPTGISTGMVILVFLSIWGATNGRGPFVELGSLNNVMSLQVYLLFAGAPFLVLAALVEEHKYAAQAVRESEGRFRLVANTAPVLIWMSAPDKLCDYFNQSWLDFTGRPLSAELGHGWAEGVHPDDLTACLDTYTKAFDARRPFEMQYRLRRLDGEYRWIFDAAVPRFNGDSSFAGYIGSCIDITDRKLAEEALSSMGRRLIKAHEEERGRIARELHDDINQRLALLANGVQEFEQAASSIRDPALKNQLRALWRLTNEIATDIQHMSHQLHPSKLHYLGLAAAIRDLCNEFSLKHKIQVECVVRDLPQDLDENVSLNLFRTVQESLRNVFKHSQARHVKVELACQSDVVQLHVSDDGIGFNPQDVRNSHGLGMISMRERLRLVGGEFAIWSKPSLGTQVEGRAPATRKDLHTEQDSAAD
jgi:PAS domain S-box-containing protein